LRHGREDDARGARSCTKKIKYYGDKRGKKTAATRSMMAYIKLAVSPRPNAFKNQKKREEIKEARRMRITREAHTLTQMSGQQKQKIVGEREGGGAFRGKIITPFDFEGRRGTTEANAQRDG